MKCGSSVAGIGNVIKVKCKKKKQERRKRKERKYNKQVKDTNRNNGEDYQNLEYKKKWS